MEQNNNFNPEIKKILNLAQTNASTKNSKIVSLTDVLTAIFQLNSELIEEILKTLAISTRQLLKIIEENSKNHILAILKNKITFSNRLNYDPNLKTVFSEAQRQAEKLNDYVISAEHLLLAFAKTNLPEINTVFKKTNLNYEKILSALTQIIELKGSKTPFLDQYGEDLTAKARLNALDPVLGRFEEIERIIQVMSRRRKNNPILFGSPGVGKTAIIEGIAQKIIEGTVNEKLKNKRIIELSVNSIISGASKRGEFEKRLKKILDETKHSGGEIILFFDEIHTLVDPLNSPQTANILKPALARGEIQAIGATTTSEYRKYLEKDAAFERRFQPILIEEPSPEECFFILKGLKNKYEKFHNIEIPDQILEETIALSTRYITNRYLPDKALDLMDEAASYSKTPSITYNEKIDSLKNLLEYKKEKLKKQNNSNEKLSEEINKIENKIKNTQKREIKKILDKESLQETISKLTGIPINHLKKNEQETLLNIEDYLNQNIIGQTQAIKTINNAILRNKAGLNKADRPIGSFIFSGPTGVGKTELAEQLCKYLLGSKDKLIRLDMSEYSEKHASAKLIGAPPGYIGYEEGGQLTEKIRTSPYSVILFDEIEKADPEIFNLLLQILDEGHLTDNQGNKVNFKNTIIICTTNIATDPNTYDRNSIISALKKFLKPEIINRFDELIQFNVLEKESIIKIVDLIQKETNNNLNGKNLQLHLTQSAKEKITEMGFNPEFGARPLKYAFQREIETPLAAAIIKNEFQSGDQITCDFKNNQFNFIKLI